MKRLLAAVALLVVAAACSDDDPSVPTTTSRSTTTTPTTTTTSTAAAAPETTTTTATTPPTPATTAATGPSAARPPAVRTQKLVTLSRPLAMTFNPANGELYVAEKGGRVRHRAASGWEPVLELDVSTGGEQGLLGLAIHPSGSHLYLHYTDAAGDSHVDEYAIDGSGRPVQSSRRQLVFVDQPFANHNGGHVAFGPDGLLYIGFGDGGSQGDPKGNGQNPDVLLGKILRMDARAAGAKPSVFALGARNPWRFSFDRATGDMWIGDVGGSSREEVDRIPAGRVGANLGWDLMEGTQRTGDAGQPANYLGPVHEYSTRAGGNCAVTGGFVYRGNAIPGLKGFYVFGDYCAGSVLALRPESPGESMALGVEVSQLASFAEDANGELYALSLDGDIVQLVAG